MPNVEVYELARHVGVTHTVGIVVINSLATNNHCWVKRALLAPRVEVVGEIKIFNLLCVHVSLLSICNLWCALWYSRARI